MAEIVKKATLRNPAFWVCLILSIGLLVMGFFFPPTAKIDGSVLSACGILFAFATLEAIHVAIKKGVDAKVKHGNTELTVGDLNDRQNSNGSEIEE